MTALAGRHGAGSSRRWMARAAFAAVAAAVLVPTTAAFASGGATGTGADVQVSGSASTGSPNPGAAYSYTFLVKNSGPATATSVVLTDPLPAGTVYNYATVNGSTLPCAAFGELSGGASVVCNIGEIAKGGQATVNVNLNAPLVATTVTNTGTVSASSSDPSSTNNAIAVSVNVKAGNAGGVNRGGVNDTGTGTAAPCASLSNVSAPVGYYSVWAAVWNTFTVKSCSTNFETVNLSVTETNTATGSVDFSYSTPMSLGAGQSGSMVIDNDFAPFNTSYRVDYTVSDPATDAVLATTSVNAVTPPPQ